MPAPRWEWVVSPVGARGVGRSASMRLFVPLRVHEGAPINGCSELPYGGSFRIAIAFVAKRIAESLDRTQRRAHSLQAVSFAFSAFFCDYSSKQPAKAEAGPKFPRVGAASAPTRDGGSASSRFTPRTRLETNCFPNLRSIDFEKSPKNSRLRLVQIPFLWVTMRLGWGFGSRQ